MSMRSDHLEITQAIKYMKFVTECLLPPQKSAVLLSPILTKQSYIPCKITITEIVGGEEVPVSCILCRVHAGGQEVGCYGEPTLRISNEIDLSGYMSTVEKTGKVSITVTSRSPDPKRLKVCTEYQPSYGGLLLEEKLDHYENLLKDIHSKGHCTRMVMSFSKEITSLEFASVSECVDEPTSWIEPFNIPIDTDLDLDDQVYTIDFTTQDLGAQYSECLNFLETRVVSPKKHENDNEPCYMYVSAYGFPHNSGS